MRPRRSRHVAACSSNHRPSGRQRTWARGGGATALAVTAGTHEADMAAQLTPMRCLERSPLGALLALCGTGPLTSSRAGESAVEPKSHLHLVSSGRSGLRAAFVPDLPTHHALHHVMNAVSATPQRRARRCTPSKHSAAEPLQVRHHAPTARLPTALCVR
jgi:hypothetical protein